MGDVATVETQSAIESHPDQVFDFLQQLTELIKIVPLSFHDAKVVDGNPQYEFFLFGEKITVKLKAEKIDDAKRSLIFTVIKEDKNKKNTALMIKLTVNDGNITWSLQFVDSLDVSEDVTRQVKAVVDLVIKALDVYLQFSMDSIGPSTEDYNDQEEASKTQKEVGKGVEAVESEGR